MGALQFFILNKVNLNDYSEQYGIECDHFKEFIIINNYSH